MAALGARRGARVRARERPLLRGRAVPFTGEVLACTEAWADKRLDISNPAVAAAAPELIEVVLARAFGDAGVIRRSWRLSRVALQLLAEERVGAPIRESVREEESAEDAAMAAARRQLGVRR